MTLQFAPGHLGEVSGRERSGASENQANKMWDVSYLELKILLTATLRGGGGGKTTKIWWCLRETGNWEEIVGKSVPKKTAFT